MLSVCGFVKAEINRFNSWYQCELSLRLVSILVQLIELLKKNLNFKAVLRDTATRMLKNDAQSISAAPKRFDEISLINDAESLFFGLDKIELSTLVAHLDLRGSIDSALSESSAVESSVVTAENVRKELQKRGFAYPKAAKRIAFLMCKGGVGKTTLSYFLGLRLASFGARVLFIDSDPQSNLTLSLRLVEQERLQSNGLPVLVDVLAKRVSIQKAILRVAPNLHILPSTAVNSLLERDLLSLRSNPIRRFSEVIQAVEKQYDYVITDCAPTLNIFNASVAYAADLLLLPFQLNEFSKVGLTQTVAEIHDLEKQFQFKTEIRAVLNLYDANDELSKHYLKALSRSFRSIFLQSVIRKSAEVQKTLAYGRDLFRTAESTVKDDFDLFAREIFSMQLAERDVRASERDLNAGLE